MAFIYWFGLLIGPFDRAFGLPGFIAVDVVLAGVLIALVRPRWTTVAWIAAAVALVLGLIVVTGPQTDDPWSCDSPSSMEACR